MQIDMELTYGVFNDAGSSSDSRTSDNRMTNLSVVKEKAGLQTNM
jgi:hypothetical protein